MAHLGLPIKAKSNKNWTSPLISNSFFSGDVNCNKDVRGGRGTLSVPSFLLLWIALVLTVRMSRSCVRCLSTDTTTQRTKGTVNPNPKEARLDRR